MKGNRAVKTGVKHKKPWILGKSLDARITESKTCQLNKESLK